MVGVPWETTKAFSLAGAGTVEIAVPTRVELTKFVAVGASLVNDRKVNLYNRKLIDSDVVYRIQPYVYNGATKIVVRTVGEFLANAGDSVTLGSTGVGNYNGAKTVLQRLPEGELVLDVAFEGEVAPVTEATIAYDLSAMAELYRVIPEQTVAGNKVVYNTPVPFVNMDPRTRWSSTYRRVIYLHIDGISAGTASLAFSSPEFLG